MLDSVPTFVWPFVLAVIAVLAGRMLSGGRVKDDAASLPGWILYAVAIGCVIIGIATWWLSHHV